MKLLPPCHRGDVPSDPKGRLTVETCAFGHEITLLKECKSLVRLERTRTGGETISAISK